MLVLSRRFDSSHDLSRILDTQTELRLQNGAIFAVPIPQEYEAKGEMIQGLVNQAIAESEANGMSKRGKDVTPWLLARVVELTKGESMESNMALLRNTARVGKIGSPTMTPRTSPHELWTGGQIANQYAKLASGRVRTSFAR